MKVSDTDRVIERLQAEISDRQRTIELLRAAQAARPKRQRAKKATMASFVPAGGDIVKVAK